MFLTKLLYFVCVLNNINLSDSQAGPDPWHQDNGDVSYKIHNEMNLPSDIRPLRRKTISENKAHAGIGEWFFRRTLAIVLRSGQIQKSEDGSIDIALQMKFDSEKWKTLNEYLKSDAAFNEDMFRRSLGYIEEAIYKPTITEKIAMAWSDHVQIYLTEYKSHITWTFGGIAGIIVVLWLWQHMSHRHVIIIIFILLYLYEVFISYKEAEEQEFQRFMSAVNTCKWYFWTSQCDVPPPSATLFFKHMNPLKIGIRMFTSLISEPFVTLSDTVNTMIQSVTGDLWFPFNKIIHLLLAISINIILICLLIMILFNYILNIPFKLNYGLLGIGLGQRDRSFSSQCTNSTNNQSRIDNGDRISGTTLNRLLDVVSQALNNGTQQRVNVRPQLTAVEQSRPSIKRSASTGRLPNVSSVDHDSLLTDGNRRRRNIIDCNAGGDAK